MTPGTEVGADRFVAGAAKDAASARKASHMLEWIVILLVVAAIASLLGFRGVAGASAGIAKVLILIVLVGFLLLLFFGVIAFA